MNARKNLPRIATHAAAALTLAFLVVALVALLAREAGAPRTAHAQDTTTIVVTTTDDTVDVTGKQCSDFDDGGVLIADVHTLDSDGTTVKNPTSGKNQATSLREALCASRNSANHIIITYDPATFSPGSLKVLTLTMPLTLTKKSGGSNPTNNVTIDGPGPAFVHIDGNTTTRIFEIEDANAHLTINGVALINGEASDTTGNPAYGTHGGAVYNLGVLELGDDTGIYASHADGNGGAVFNDAGGMLLLTGAVSLTGNSATNGGAVYNNGSGSGVYIQPPAKVGVANSINEATTNGGGIYNNGGTVHISGTVAYNETTGGNGGGIYQNSGTMVISGGVLMESFARNGGGIFVAGGSATLVRSSVLSNTALQNGGGIASSGGTLLVERSTVAENDAVGSGGGIASSGGSVATLSNSTLSGNIANQQGGGLFNASTLTISRSTVTNNAAINMGGGLKNNATANAAQSIIAANKSLGSAPDCSGSLTSQGYVMLSDSSGCTVNTANGSVMLDDPQLDALADNGGATLTHHPQASSPVVNVIPEAACSGVPDQRDVMRPQGTACDIGAVEKYPTVQFSSSAYSVTEGVGNAQIAVFLDFSSTEIVSATYEMTSSGSATAGADYTVVSGTVGFQSGALTRTISVPIIDDELDEGDETFSLLLKDVTGGATTGTPDHTTVTIIDNDEPAFTFTSATYTVTENAGTAQVPVALTISSTQEVSVVLTTSDGSATAGVDYATYSATLTFAPGTMQQTVSIPILDDDQIEDDETFNLALSSPLSGTLFGEHRTATMTIVDNEGRPVVQFGSASDRVPEDTGTLTMNVVVDPAPTRAVSVTYSALDHSAVNGADYVAGSGQLGFSPVRDSATFTITILTDQQRESDETFSLVLSDPINPLVLGTPYSITITIEDLSAGRVYLPIVIR